MRIFNKNLIINLFVVSLVLGLVGPITASAATTPDLGTAATFGILTGTFNHDIATTTITGVVGTNALGYTGEAGVGPVVVVGNTITAGAAYAAAGIAQGDALTALSAPAQPCGNGTTIPGYTFANGVVNLATNTERGGTTGHYSPGVYCITGAMNIGTAGIILDTAGTYIFRSTGAFTTVTGSSVGLSGGVVSACNVFWIPGEATTLAANTEFAGTIIDDAGITINNLVSWEGRALAYAAGSGVVTADTTTLTVPTCAAAVNGACGTANAVAVYTVPSANLCLNGTTPTAVSGTGPWTWGCNGLNGGTSTAGDACSAPKKIDGTCGTSATSYLSTDAAFSGTMCALGSGITTPASPTFPTAGNSVTWTCGGSNDGSSSATCTATRAAVPLTYATLTLVKSIVGGSRTYADFPLTATGPTVITGVYPAAAITNATVLTGSYTLSETTQSDYTAGSWSCLKNATLPAITGASITLVSGDSAICTIQNTYIAPPSGGGPGGGNSYNSVPPLIDIVKVPSPLALPSGPGPVTYTYTVRNIGTVPMTNVTVADSVCSPMVFVSGDINSDSKLDVNETWTYDCFKTLSATQTNTVVATGWANNISATDIATATVVVGVPIVPPLIHVTKVPSPIALPAGGGMVTYAKNVTNPGTVALSNIQLVDDKCSSVKYISGDTNGDLKLDPIETWTYTCSANLNKTTTNTVVATGQANGLTARDFAIATVVVAVPSLPNTGFPPESKNIQWGLLAGAMVLVLASVIMVLKKRMSGR